MRQALNNVKIEGLLVEKDIEYATFGSPARECIRGSIKIRVTQKINGEEVVCDVPVHLFSTKITKANKINPSYESIEKVMTEYNSLASVGGDETKADKVRITSGQIQMNEYYNRNNKLVSFPRITASFINRATGEYKPCAEFAVEFVVVKGEEEMDKDGIMTGKYLIKGVIPQYGGRVDLVPFHAINKNVVSAVSTYWNEGDTVRAVGKLNFTSETREVEEEVDFGEPQIRTQTVSTSELVITGGSQTPLDGDFAFDKTEIKTALSERMARLEEGKNKTTTAAAPTSGFGGLGF